MLVAASTRCFPNDPLPESLRKLAELEYAAAEIVVGGHPSDLAPEQIAEDFELAVRNCLWCRPIRPMSFFFDVPTDDPDYMAKFEHCCRLAKRIKVVLITVLSAPLGTPYNEEIERLRRISAIGLREGIVIGVLTERGCITESCDSIESLIKSVPQLSVTLDPSHFIYGRPKVVDYDPIMPYVCHIRLRDTTPDAFQVQIGQGILEYNRILVQLLKTKYRGAFCVDLAPLPDLDQESELRKMRLLLESLL